MQLKSMTIRLSEYGTFEGRYTGTVHFAGEYGGVDIVLTPDMSDKVLHICADAMVAQVKEVAENLTAAVIIQANTPALAAPQEGR